MDIKEIKEQKSVLEAKIRDLLIEFSTNTTLCVDSIRFEMSENYLGKFSCTSVRVDIRLDDE